MKILIDTSPLDSGHAIRGIGTYTRLLVENLEKISGLEVVRSETELGEDFKPDLVHYPYFDLFFPTLPLIRRQATVVTIHDVIPLVLAEHYPVGIKGKAALMKQKSAVKTVGAVITDSASSKADIHQHLGVPLDKIHVVYLAANPELQVASTKEINRVRRKYGLPKNYVLYVGDINYNKNIPQLIKMVRDLPRHTKLVCVGKAFVEQDIPEWQWIETQLALSDVKDRVKFVTDVPGGQTADLAAIYSGADCYIQPSLYEGFGLPVLEAMQCQVPVVMTENSSLIEVGGKAALFAEPEAESLADQVNQVLNWTKKEREAHIKKAYKWSQKFSWKKTAQETAQVYQQLLKNA